MDINRLGVTETIKEHKISPILLQTHNLDPACLTIYHINCPKLSKHNSGILHLGSYHRAPFIVKRESLLNQVTSCWFFPPEHSYFSRILKTHIYVFFHMFISKHFFLFLLSLFSVIDLLINQLILRFFLEYSFSLLKNILSLPTISEPLALQNFCEQFIFSLLWERKSHSVAEASEELNKAPLKFKVAPSLRLPRTGTRSENPIPGWK